MARVEARLPLTPDGVTSALVGDGRRLVSAIGGGAMTRSLGDASLLITGVPIPMLNGVLTVKTAVTAADVNSLLDEVADRGMPYSVQIRPGCRAEITELAKARGMVEDEPIPLMAMASDIESLGTSAQHREMSIRLLEPDEARLHAQVGAEGFEAPVEVFERLVTPASLSLPGFRAYIGIVNGEPVTTALGSTNGDYVGVFNVATPPRHRGRGYGAAITARATLDGFKDGVCSHTCSRRRWASRSTSASATRPSRFGRSGSAGCHIAEDDLIDQPLDRR